MKNIYAVLKSKPTLLLAVVLSFIAHVFSQEPGSGNTLSFNGSNQYADLPSTLTQNFGSNFTVQCWVKPSANNYRRIISRYSGGGAPAPGDFIIDTYYPTNTGRALRFWMSNGSVASFIYVDNVLTLNRWNHVAATFDTGAMKLYVNGILVQSGTASFTALPTSGYDVKIGEDRFINVPEFFQGQIDELSFWDVTLTQTEIRDWVCKKLNSTHPQYTNLAGYYMFDEGAGSTTSDSANGLNGTLINNPTWNVSGAPVGDEMAYQYSSTPNVSLTHPDGDILTINNFTGSPDGVFVYYVSQTPNTLSGTLGVGNNDKYFGVHKLGDPSAIYSATYDYGAYSGIGSENDLVLYSRSDNAATSWANCGANLDVNANTLTATGQSTEYILGSSGVGLPVSLVSFEIKLRKQDEALLHWETASETNNHGFSIERSTDGLNWEVIQFVYGAGNTHSIRNYELKDVLPERKVYYYRLIQVDFNGKKREEGIKTIDNRKKIEVIRRVNLLGQEVDENYEGIVILQYDNGTLEKLSQ